MKTLGIILVTATLTAHLAVVLAADATPNWSNRHEEIKKELLQNCRVPVVGETVTIERTIDGKYTGRLDALSANAIVVDGKQYLARQLTSASRKVFFPEVYASATAQQQVAREYNALRQREAQARLARQGIAHGAAATPARNLPYAMIAPIAGSDRSATPIVSTETTTAAQPREETAKNVAGTEQVETKIGTTEPNSSNSQAAGSADVLFWACCIAAIAVLIALIVMTAVGVAKAKAMKVIFFNSKWDLAIPLLPLTVLLPIYLIPPVFTIFAAMLGGALFLLPIAVPLAVLPVALLYNAVQAFRLNWDTKGLALCVTVGRTVIGFVAPAWILFNFLGVFRERRQDESAEAFAFRSAGARAASIALAGGLFYSLARLINGDRVRMMRLVDRLGKAQDEMQDMWKEFVASRRDSSAPTDESRTDPTSAHTDPPQPPPAYDFDWACRTLGVSAEASEADIDRAFQQKMSEFHPDQLRHLDSTARQTVQNKAREINKAHRMLKGRKQGTH